MSLWVLEGMDRVGKSTTADLLRRRYKAEYIHMTVPARWHVPYSYFTEVLHLLMSTYGKNVVMDRSFYGEAVWPHVYNRVPLLDKQNMYDLIHIAKILHKQEVQCIYMYDPNTEAHKNRLLQDKEPLYDYDKVSLLYKQMAIDHKFSTIDLPGAIKLWT